MKNIDTNEEITLSQDEISYDASSRTVTINPENDFSELCAYELIITGISSGDKVMKDKTVKFITSSRLEIGNITLEGAKPVTPGGKVSARVTVTNNTSSPAKSPALILALYDTSASKEIKISGEGEKKRFTVRKMSDNIGVERIFPIESPFIDSITVNKYGKVRRAKLYYLRGLTGKKARIKERRVSK